MSRNNLDKQMEQLVKRIDAEKVSITLSYDRNLFWQRRGRRERAAMHYDIEVEWEDHGENLRFDGDVHGGSFARVLDNVEAQIDGYLLRTRADETRMVR